MALVLWVRVGVGVRDDNRPLLSARLNRARGVLVVAVCGCVNGPPGGGPGRGSERAPGRGRGKRAAPIVRTIRRCESAAAPAWVSEWPYR